jgi:hypothetical protein
MSELKADSIRFAEAAGPREGYGAGMRSRISSRVDPRVGDDDHSFETDLAACCSIAFSRIPTIRALRDALSSFAQLASCSWRTGGIRIWK